MGYSYSFQFNSSTITVLGKYSRAACRMAVSDLLHTEKCRQHFAQEFCFSQPQKHDSNASFIVSNRTPSVPFNTTQPSNCHHIGFSNVFQGIAGLYYTVSSLNVRTVNSTLREFEDAGRRYCETPWANATKTNDSGELQCTTTINSH